MERAGNLSADRTLIRETPLHSTQAARISVSDGPAWNGYVALR
jgi:hypothetical protein